jgi:hypothetical protein
MFSGVPEMSVDTTITSLATPPSSHIFAVSTAELPDEHMAPTFITGPWKSWRVMKRDSTVDGIRCRYSWLFSRRSRSR